MNLALDHRVSSSHSHLRAGIFYTTSGLKKESHHLKRQDRAKQIMLGACSSPGESPLLPEMSFLSRLAPNKILNSSSIDSRMQNSVDVIPQHLAVQLKGLPAQSLLVARGEWVKHRAQELPNVLL